MTPEIEEAVRRWFDGDIRDFTRDGKRSVRFAHPVEQDRVIKIKGAGYRGGRIRYGDRLQSGLKAPIFDFEGRMTEDHAAGHDNAYLGAATFQQSVVEYAVSSRLDQLGYRVVPCVGYGRVGCSGYTSWFSVFEIFKDWSPVAGRDISTNAYLEAKLHYGEEVRQLAIGHELIGYYWYMRDSADNLILKDLHPFRHAHPLNMSRTTWAMHVFFALHIAALATTNFARRWGMTDLPSDASAFPFRAFDPEATTAEHDAVRFHLVTEYMRGEPEGFDPVALNGFLLGHRLTRRILEACPETYEAF